MKYRLLALPFFLLAFFVGKAQDIHFSMYDMSPLTLNPALTGAYEGSYRIGGIYRSQWNSSLYSTPSFFVDSPVIMGFGKNDWIGAGGVFYQDQAGVGKVTTSIFMFSASYHRALDKKAKNILTLGVQGGSLSVNVNNAAGFIAGDELATNGQTTDQTLIGLQGQQNNNQGGGGDFDFNLGLLLTSQINKTTRLRLGASGVHLLAPAKSLTSGGGGNNPLPGPNPNPIGGFGQEDSELPFRIQVHGELEAQLTDKLGIAPTFYFTDIRTSNQFALQAWGNYLLNEEKAFKLRFGLGHRLGRDLQVLLGVDYGDLRAGFSYDLGISQVRDALRNANAFEIGVWYVGKIYKNPEVPPSLLCPAL